MSKYVKELMMDQLRSDLDGSRSVLILDLKGLDAIAEHQFRRDLRKKSIQIRALKNTLARRVFAEMGMDGLCAVSWRARRWPSGAATGSPSWPRRSPTQVKKLKKPEIKGGAVDGVVIGPAQVEDITKLPSREALIGRVVALALAPVAAGRRPGQRPGRRPDGPAQDPVRRRAGGEGDAEAEPRPADEAAAGRRGEPAAAA